MSEPRVVRGWAIITDTLWSGGDVRREYDEPVVVCRVSGEGAERKVGPVEAWMVEWMKNPDTPEAWALVPEELRTDDLGRTDRWAVVDHYIAVALREILEGGQSDD